MPPKRKAAEPKVDDEVKEAPKKRGRKKEPDVVEELGNGDIEPPKKAARGRQAKKVEEVNDDAQKPEPKKAKGRAKKEKVTEIDEDTEEVEPKKSKGRTKKQIPPETDVAEEVESVSEPKKTKGRQKKQPVEKIVENEDEEKPKKGRGRQKKQKETDVEDDQEMEDADMNVESNDVEEKPKKGRGRQKKQKQADVEDDKEIDEAETVENNVEDKPKKGRGRQKKPNQADVENDQELDEPEAADDDVKVEEKPKKGRGRQKKQKEMEVEDEQELDDEVEKEKPGTKRGRGKQANLKEASDSDESAVSKPKRGRKKGDEVEKPKPTLVNKIDTDYSNIDFSCTKTSKDGEEANIVVASWNVDGLRAWLKKNGLKYIQAENADILCLQETKCSQEKLPEEIIELDGYKKYWASSKKDGYAGVALFSKVMPIDVKYGIGNEDHDEEGRCITAEFKKFFVVSVYVPNAGRKLVTLPKRMEWNDLFMKFVQDLDKIKPVIICGDMNVAHCEIDLSNPKTNKKNAGFTPEERDGMTEFLECGFVDTYRKLYPDKEKAYTFWTYMMNARSKNVGWRLDYFLLSERLADSVCDNVIRNTIYGSDHCPITLFLNIK